MANHPIISTEQLAVGDVLLIRDEDVIEERNFRVCKVFQVLPVGHQTIVVKFFQLQDNKSYQLDEELECELTTSLFIGKVKLTRKISLTSVPLTT